MKPKRPPSGTSKPNFGAGSRYAQNLASQKYISGPQEFNKMGSAYIRQMSREGYRDKQDEKEREMLSQLSSEPCDKIKKQAINPLHFGGRSSANKINNMIGASSSFGQNKENDKLKNINSSLLKEMEDFEDDDLLSQSQ